MEGAGTLIWETDFKTTFEQNMIPQSYDSHRYKQLAEIRFPKDPANPADELGFLMFEHDQNHNSGDLALVDSIESFQEFLDEAQDMMFKSNDPLYI